MKLFDKRTIHSGQQLLYTMGDLTPIFPTFSNLLLNLSFYTNADPKSRYLSNIQQNKVWVKKLERCFFFYLKNDQSYKNHTEPKV